jgi:IrrE N-terminal-like domain
MTWSDPVVLALCAKHENPDVEALVHHLCQTLLERCPTDSGPSPLDVLGSCQGVRQTIAAKLSPDRSSMLIPYDGGYKILLNEEHPPERQHFSRGHEIVHTYFRELSAYHSNSAEIEELCDLGAVELTMPTERFRAALAKFGTTLAGVLACSKEFGVSLQAAMRRAMELTNESACELVGTLRAAAGASEQVAERPVLRVQHWNPSATWSESGDYTDATLRDGSIIHQAFTHLDNRAGREELGSGFGPGVFNIEAQGVRYVRLGDPDHREVIALIRAGA